MTKVSQEKWRHQRLEARLPEEKEAVSCVAGINKAPGLLSDPSKSCDSSCGHPQGSHGGETVTRACERGDPPQGRSRMLGVPYESADRTYGVEWGGDS